MPPPGAELSELIDEAIALFHRLKAAAESTYGEGEASAGRRGLLRSLAAGGAQTVPALARARPVSRQHVQMLINGLLSDGLIRRTPNPAHRRSPLLELTPAGARRVKALTATDTRLFARLSEALPPRRLTDAAKTLRQVRAALERSTP